MRKLTRFEIEKVFEQLDALGWVSRILAPRASDPPHWIVNPAVHELFAERAKQEAARRAEIRAMIVEDIDDAR
jgi:hypothetical protein